MRWDPSWSRSPAESTAAICSRSRIAHSVPAPWRQPACLRPMLAEEMDEARIIASEIGAEHVLVDTAELTDPRYADNTHQRCFFCKTELYSRLKELAESRGLQHVVDGSNADDLDDFRPGMRAARELGVRSPLQEVGLTKAEIRLLSERLGSAHLGQAGRGLSFVPIRVRRSDNG